MTKANIFMMIKCIKNQLNPTRRP